MSRYNPMRQLPAMAGYGKGDLLVLCGELFGRGYANGIVDEARRRGMGIIGTTVGRRDGNGLLRPLFEGELDEAEELLDGEIINIPLEAGFDMEASSSGITPVEMLKGAKPDDWEGIRLDWDAIEESKKKGRERFRSNLDKMVMELDKLIPPGANVLFVHCMAGGVPRARLLMPIFNRVFKGQGERYLSSEKFWGSDLGRLCKESFDEVSADTFSHLVEATANCRERITAAGGRVSYAAYGYHGCEVLVGNEYRWQSYTPYLTGWAKIRLEGMAAEAMAKGIGATVFNCPEIQTNSSALFMGVEISLYPFLSALEREGDGAAAKIREECASLLKDDATIDQLLAGADQYLSSPVLDAFRDYTSWPHHNTLEQAELMLNCSAQLMGMNKNPKEIVGAVLSKAVFNAVGKLMLDAMWEPSAPVVWLNHDIIARRLASP